MLKLIKMSALRTNKLFLLLVKLELITPGPQYSTDEIYDVWKYAERNCPFKKEVKLNAK